MIRCVITYEVQFRGVEFVVARLREAGIPVRVSGQTIRLCQEWAGADAAVFGSGQVVGYGRLECQENFGDRTVEFRYHPPADPNVIDIEAREIIDQLQIANDK